jgi:squalene-hopene/tetraprenyl-beta-curcumene cyclase
MASGTRVEFEPPAGQPAAARPIFAERLAEAIDRGVNHLLSLQAQEGYWLGELEADTTLESDYILYLHVLGRSDQERVAKLANYVRRRQLADGGWNIYYAGPSELNATVKAYFALKLAGDVPESAHMQQARERIHELGGLEATNSYTRFYLAMVGGVGWDMVPAVPPELMLLPNWFAFNIYEMSSWTRGIVIPLAILYAQKPYWPVPEHARVAELFRDPSRKAAAFAWDVRPFTWRNLFLALDRVFKLYERLPWKPLRQRALRQAEEWLLEHIERSDGLAAIYPAMMNAIFALLAMGHPPDDPLTAREIDELARFEIEDRDTIRVQPCVSPVWDTAIAMVALEEAGLPPDHPALVQAAEWLLAHQVLGSGDWQVKNPGVEPGGWVFEFRNDFYPDVDDTAFVLMALQRVKYPATARLEAAARRGLTWLLSMQNRDGGWGAFDHDNDRRFLTQIPFADHNAMIDPSTADVTARVLECLGRCGWPSTQPVIERAVRFLLRDQTPEGAWYGRWGVNYVYGTSGVLRAFETVALTAQECCQRAVAWLRAVQNGDGGFGESIASYYDSKLMGQGISTPSQTAWGLIGLLAGTAHEAAGTNAGDGDGRESNGRQSDSEDAPVSRAVAHLIEQQNADGSWDEDEFTGTGFPCVFYLKYHLYRNYFPLYALSRYRNQRAGAREFRAFEIRPETLKGNGASRSREVVGTRRIEGIPGHAAGQLAGQAADQVSEMEQASP